MPAKPQVKVRKPPTPVTLAAAESFVSTGRSGAQAPKRSKGRAHITRADGRVLERLTIYLPAELGTRLAVRCAETGEDKSDYVSEAVAARLDG